MAKTSEPNSATNQFHVNLNDSNVAGYGYSVFEQVVAGMDVVDTIGKVQTNTNERLSQAIRLIRVELFG